MPGRNLKITINPNWQAMLRAASRKARSMHYQGEVLNFEKPELFLSRLTALRWNIVKTLLGAGELPVREVARRVRRDVKRVHGDIEVLTGMGLLERTATGGVICPFDDIHIDLHLTRAA